MTACNERKGANERATCRAVPLNQPALTYKQDFIRGDLLHTHRPAIPSRSVYPSRHNTVFVLGQIKRSLTNGCTYLVERVALAVARKDSRCRLASAMTAWLPEAAARACAGTSSSFQHVSSHWSAFKTRQDKKGAEKV